MVKNLNSHGDWVYYNTKLQEVSSGNGTDSLKRALPDNECGFVHFLILAENVGNSGAGIMTEARIILQWKGPSTGGMAKVKNNGALQAAFNTLTPNKGHIEVLGKAKLDVETIFDRWRPGSGSKVIQDD